MEVIVGDHVKTRWEQRRNPGNWRRRYIRVRRIFGFSSDPDSQEEGTQEQSRKKKNKRKHTRYV